jgi:protein-S-isoprenylcysteine O-methyltransferase Ste14
MPGRIFAAFRSLFYASAFGLFWYMVVLWFRPLDHRFSFNVPAIFELPGIILATLGAILAFACVAAFSFIGRGTPAPFDAPREFVAAGPYRYVRNPMYIGAFCVIVGAGLAMRSVSALLVALGFIIIAHLFILIYEEPTLERRFGESYRIYKKKVDRWIPVFQHRAHRD